jgi:hypothetical protein
VVEIACDEYGFSGTNLLDAGQSRHCGGFGSARSSGLPGSVVLLPGQRLSGPGQYRGDREGEHPQASRDDGGEAEDRRQAHARVHRFVRAGLRRKAVAIEPMTCPPTAFVTGDDLLVL